MGELNNELVNEVLKVPKILTFVEWMQTNVKSNPILKDINIKKLLPSKWNQKDKEIKKIDFLNRRKAESQENDNRNNINDEFLDP